MRYRPRRRRSGSVLPEVSPIALQQTSLLSERAGNTFCGYLSGLRILAIGLILAYEVVMRGIFEPQTIWVMNTAIYLFMWTMRLARLIR